MARGPSEKGIAIRDRILVELARRWEDLEPPVSAEIMAGELGLRPGTLRYHIDRLRISGLIRTDSLWLTKPGLAHVLEIRKRGGLTD